MKEAQWEFVALVPLFDPPRHDTGDTVARCLEKGIMVKMITGDHLDIGQETARQLGMGYHMHTSHQLTQVRGKKIVLFVLHYITHAPSVFHPGSAGFGVWDLGFKFRGFGFRVQHQVPLHGLVWAPQAAGTPFLGSSRSVGLCAAPCWGWLRGSQWAACSGAGLSVPCHVSWHKEGLQGPCH